jgi:hypothetical protein
MEYMIKLCSIFTHLWDAKKIEAVYYSFDRRAAAFTMSSLLDAVLARPASIKIASLTPVPSSSRVVAKFTIESLTMVVVFNYKDKAYYILNTNMPNQYIRIPNGFTVGNTITWFYNTQCAPIWNEEPIYTNPSLMLHKQNGDRLYPLRPLSVCTSLRLLQAKWSDLSPNPIIGTLNFK